MIPGELRAAPGEIELNAGRERIELELLNTGDRPIQVGSHFHAGTQARPRPVDPR